MEHLRQELVNLINESGLPLEAVVFVVRDVYRDVDAAFKNFLEQEKKQQQEASSLEDSEK